MPDVGSDDQIEVDHEGEAVCSADVSIDEESRVARVSLHAESGHLPAGVRERLVDEVLALPQVKSSEHVSMSVPRGDAESLARLRQRCDDLSVRPTGSTVIVEMDSRKGDDASSEVSKHEQESRGGETPS
jgi:hypothetical protein